MITLCFTIGFSALVLSTIPIAIAMIFCRRINSALKKTDYGYRPKAALLVPCKGLDPDFKKNIEALFTQDYPDYEIVFITATQDDPASPVLEEIIEKNPQISSRLVIAGTATGRSQKVNNQLRGVREVREDCETLVFVDSDAQPATDFLKNLVAPLKNLQVGIATGFRWYLPVCGGFSSLLRSTWNGGGVAFLTDRVSNYAWGGAMAIRKATFVDCNVISRWENALSDDMTITQAVREKGLEIQFVPRCLVAIHEDCSFSEMIEWTNRQTIISKVYHPKLWQRIAIAHGVINIILGLGTILLAGFLMGMIADERILLSSILMLAAIPLEMINGLFLFPAAKKMMPDHSEKIRKLVWKYCLMAPLASFLVFLNTIYSLFTNRITWRGIKYEMRSPTETIICR